MPVRSGGGLSVSGNAGLSGSGVVIVNAGSAYPNPGGNYGGISFTGNGSLDATGGIFAKSLGAITIPGTIAGTISATNARFFGKKCFFQRYSIDFSSNL